MDRDGALNDNEVRTLAVYLKGAPLPSKNYTRVLRAAILSCDRNMSQFFPEPAPVLETNATSSHDSTNATALFSPNSTETSGSPTTQSRQSSGDSRTTNRTNSASETTAAGSGSGSGSSQSAEMGGARQRELLEMEQNNTTLPPGATEADMETMMAIEDESSWRDDLNVGRISLGVLQSCRGIWADVREVFGSRPKNRHQELETDDVAFIMIGTNATTVEGTNF
jgi:hypothetical protein